MKAIMIPLVVTILAAIGGIGAGMTLKLSDELIEDTQDQETLEEEKTAETTYVELGDQFIVPLLQDGIIAEHIILSISLESSPENVEILAKKLPKLRAAFIIALYDHASLGGFEEPLANVQMLKRVSDVLQNSAEHTIPDLNAKVLVTNFIRQNA